MTQEVKSNLAMKRKILLAEDDTDSREALAMLLDLEGFDVITACDGNSALLQALERLPDIVITDICMPGINGIELARQLRCQPVCAQIPVIAITAASEIMRNNVLEAGAAACLAKPIELVGLLSLIENLLDPVAIGASKIA